MIERVPLKNRMMTTEFISNNRDKDKEEERVVAGEKSKKRQEHLAKMINNIPEANKTKQLGIWSAAPTPNTFNVQAQQALQPFESLRNGQNIMYFDIEAIGTPAHVRGVDSANWFSPTELSFGNAVYQDKKFVRNPKEAIVSMAIAPGEEEQKRIRKVINDAKKNKLNGITKDEHRSLIDLIKYADPLKFQEGIQLNGKTFTALKGHHRTPSPLEALTDKTLQEIEKGFNNLVNFGTSIDTAIEIFHNSVNQKNARLGGYNIHGYDLPALMGATNNKATQRLVQQMQDGSLDFYHAYTAVAKDPFTLTGANTKQENMHQYLLQKNIIQGELSSYLYHFAEHDIIANIEVSGVVANTVLDHISHSKKKPDYALNPFQLNTDVLKSGQEVFSFQSGYFDSKKHKYNLIGRVEKDKDGKEKIAPRWSSLDTSLPSNERFIVNTFFNNVELPDSGGKTGYGVRLDSKDIKGKSVMLFSETKEGLAQQLHGSFLPLDSEVAKAFRTLKAEVDQPYEEYAKMFKDGGYKKMEKFYGYLNAKDAPSLSVGKGGFDKWKQSWTEHVLKNGGTEELAMKFPFMIERLAAEKGVWEPVLAQTEKEGLYGGQIDMVIQHVKSQLDQIGSNRQEINTEGHRFLQFSFGEAGETTFNAKDPSAIKAKFRQFINGKMTGEYKGTPEESYRVGKIKELQELIIKQFGFEQESKEALKVRKLAVGMIGEVQKGGKIETALTSISNMVRDEVEKRNSGLLTRDITSSVTQSYIGAIGTFQQTLPDVLSTSISQSKALRPTPTAIEANTKLYDFVKQQDERIAELYRRNFQGSQADKVEAGAKAAARYQKSLEKLIHGYSKDFETQISFRDDGAPFLVLNEKGSGLGRKNRTYEEIAKSSKSAIVPLPWMDEEYMVTYGTGRKVPIMNMGVVNGKDVDTFSVIGALEAMSKQSKDSLNRIMSSHQAGTIVNPLFEVQRGLKRAASQHVDPVAGQAGNRSYDEMKRYDAPSKAAMHTKGGLVNISGYAKEWYRDSAVQLGIVQTSREVAANIRDIEERAEKNGTSFYDELSQEVKTKANLGSLDEYVMQKRGLNFSIHGINSTLAGRGIRGTDVVDARNLMALGHLTGDAGENQLKISRYRQLDESTVNRVLDKAGRNETWRTMSTFVATDMHEINRAGEISGITMQSASMSDEELSVRLKEAMQDGEKQKQYFKWIDQAMVDGRLSEAEGHAMKLSIKNGTLASSEGTALIDAELLKAYDGWEDVRIKTRSKDVTLHATIEGAIQQHAENLGLIEKGDKTWKTKGIDFGNHELVLNDILSKEEFNALFDKNGVMTVGKFTINNTVQGKLEEEVRLRKDKRLSFKGYSTDDVYENHLIMGRERKAGHGFKVVTGSGVRVTVTPMLKEILEDVSGLSGVEFITESLDGGKKRTNHAPQLIRGIDVGIRQRFEKGEGVKGFNSVESALQAFYDGLGSNLNIVTEVEKDGTYTISSKYGYNVKGEDAVLDYESFMTYAKEWNTKLGNTSNRLLEADEIRGHDVFENYGQINAGKITTKEIFMFNQGSIGMQDSSGKYLAKPGELSPVSQWLMDRAFGEHASPEVKAKQKVMDEVLTVMAKRDIENGWTPKAGDAVIDFTAEGSIHENITHVDDDGIIRVNKNSFQAMPRTEHEKQVLTVGDYNKTIINAGNLQVGEKTVAPSRSIKGTIWDQFNQLDNDIQMEILDNIWEAHEGKLSAMKTKLTFGAESESLKKGIQNETAFRKAFSENPIKALQEGEMGRRLASHSGGRLSYDAARDNIKPSDLEPQRVPVYLKDQVGSNHTYLKLPEGFAQQYVPIVDASSLPSAGTNYTDREIFLNNIQSKQAAIVRRLEEFNNLHVKEGFTETDVLKRREAIIDSVNSMTEELTELYSSQLTSNTGAADYMSAKLNNSTRLQSASINPILAYKKDATVGKWVNSTIYEEATQYANPHDVRNQIKGIEERIAKSWGLDPTKIEGDLTDYLIANWNDYDTFGLTNRNPSIHTNTIQVTKVKIDESVGIGQMRDMRGVSTRIKEDFDGDQKALFLSIYGEKDDTKFKVLHKELSERWQVEYERNMHRANVMMDSFEANFKESITTWANKLGDGTYTSEHKSIQAVSEAFFSPEGLAYHANNLTVGKFTGQELVSQVENILIGLQQKQNYYAEWGMSKSGQGVQGIAELERTAMARATHGTIGAMDNLRMKMENAFIARAEIQYKHFHNAEGMLRYSQQRYVEETDTVMNFLREFSQKSISAKHSNGQDIYGQVDEMYGILNDLRNVRGEENLRGLAKRIHDRGIFSSAPEMEIGVGKTYSGSSEEYIYRAVKLLSESEQDHHYIGLKGQGHASLMIGASQGVFADALTEMLQTGQHIPTMANKYMMERMQEHGYNMMQTAKDEYEQHIIRLTEKRHENLEDRLSDGLAANEIINERAVTKPQVSSNRSVPIHRTIRESMDGRFADIASSAKHSFSAAGAGLAAVGAATFAGLWATNVLMKGAPTPEGLQEMAPVDPSVMQSNTTPTARVTPNGEYISISVKASSAKRLNNADLATMLNSEIIAMSNVQMQTNVNITDNSKNIDNKWIESAIANAMNKGYAY